MREVGLLFAVLVLLAGCGGGASGVVEGLGFAIRMPPGWEIKQCNDDVVVALEPKESKDDKFRENVSVIVENVKEGTELEEYVKRRVRDMKRLSEDFYLWGNTKAALYGVTARRLVYSITFARIKCKCLAFIAVRGAYGYVVTCAAEPHRFDQLLPLFKECVGSFRFK